MVNYFTNINFIVLKQDINVGYNFIKISASYKIQFNFTTDSSFDNWKYTEWVDAHKQKASSGIQIVPIEKGKEN